MSDDDAIARSAVGCLVDFEVVTARSAVGCLVDFEGLGRGEVLHEVGGLLLIRFRDESGEPLHRIVPRDAFEWTDRFRNWVWHGNRLAQHLFIGGAPEDFEPESPDA